LIGRSALCLVASLALLQAACGNGAGWPGAAAVDSVTVGFDGLSDVIVVTTTDRLPLRSAALVAPDGEAVPAYSLDVLSSPVVVAPPGEEALLLTPGAPKRVTRVDAMFSTALIRLPDPERYAKSWPNWRVLLRLGDPGAGERAMLLRAPAPPAPPPAPPPS
jgi:hypothetical protein